MMKWESIKVRGLGPFRDEVELDLSKLGDAMVVAVSGTFGAGKSTLLELGIPGALDRRTPTRGTLLDLATARDAYLRRDIPMRGTHGHSGTSSTG